MATGRTEEERQGGRKVERQHRRNRRQGKTGRREKKDGRLSSQNRAAADERKRSEGKARREAEERRRTEGKHRWNGCGSETGKDERKLTESRVLGSESEARETGRSGSGKARKPKGGEAAPDKPL